MIGSYPFPGLARALRRPRRRAGARRPRGGAARRRLGGRRRPGAGRPRRRLRRRAEPLRLQPLLLRLPRGPRAGARAAPPLRAAGARPARAPPAGRRAARAARARRGRGVRAAARAGAGRAGAEDRRARAVHARRPDRPRRRLPGPVGRRRGARAGRPGRARPARGGGLRARPGRRAVDELLRLPRGHGSPRRPLQPDGSPSSAAATWPRTSASATTRGARSRSARTPRCCPTSSTWQSTRYTGRWPAAS